MIKFKSRSEVAKDVVGSYDENKLFSRYNDYCEMNNNIDDMVYYNDSGFLSMFSKDEIADYASYKYRSTDNYVQLSIYGFVSSNYLDDLIKDCNISDMNNCFLQNYDSEFQVAYEEYLDDLAEDETVSIQDWVENIIFYSDEDKANRRIGIYSFDIILEKFTEYFAVIYNHSDKKAIEAATTTIKERTDIFPVYFIETNLQQD